MKYLRNFFALNQSLRRQTRKICQFTGPALQYFPLAPLQIRSTSSFSVTDEAF